MLREGGEDGGSGCAGGVFHCFTETAAVARSALDHVFCISFSCMLSFKSALDLCQVASLMPLHRSQLETAIPYRDPVTHRGKTNNPSFVPFVAATLASLRGLPLETIAALTTENFETLFAGVKA